MKYLKHFLKIYILTHNEQFFMTTVPTVLLIVISPLCLPAIVNLFSCNEQLRVSQQKHSMPEQVKLV